ncbi:MAG: hypothetical protein IPG04_16530 [Polyangiaceae bacterium]|nr:hypothetical protein [Polyangiaceae bacterium]
MGAARKVRDGEAADADGRGPLSAEMVDFVDHLVDHLAELLAAEFAASMKGGRDAGGGVCEVLEREPTGTEHRRSDPGL